MKETILSMQNVWKIYDLGEVKVPALRGVNVDIKKGEFVAVIGSSGSGKSTMMNLMGCLDLPSKGKVFLKTKDISKISESDLSSFRGKTIGFIFQQYNLIPSMSAFENVMLPLEFQEYDDEIAVKKTKKMLQLVGLEDKMGNLPSRVSIARSLVGDPEIIFADEPTGALDSATGKEILWLLRKLWKEEGKTIILVTHDLTLAKTAQRIIELKDGQVVAG